MGLRCTQRNRLEFKLSNSINNSLFIRENGDIIQSLHKTYTWIA